MRLALGPFSLLMVCLGACAHGGHNLDPSLNITNEQRLEAATESSGEGVDVNTLICRYTSPEVQLARDASQSRADRIARYNTTIQHAQTTENQFDEEFRRDPDLLYGPNAAEYQKRRQACVELAVTLERERAGLEAEEGAGKGASAAQSQPAFVDEGIKPAKASKATAMKAPKAKKTRVAKAKKRGRGGALARAD
jgi:hypothetical protein